MHDISNSNEPIYLKFGVNIFYTFLYRLNHAQIKIFNFTIFKKFGIVKKTLKREIFFKRPPFCEKIFFWLFQGSCYSRIYTLIKNPFGFFASDDQKGWNHARQDPPFCQLIALWILSFFG